MANKIIAQFKTYRFLGTEPFQKIAQQHDHLMQSQLHSTLDNRNAFVLFMWTYVNDDYFFENVFVRSWDVFRYFSMFVDLLVFTGFSGFPGVVKIFQDFREFY